MVMQTELKYSYNYKEQRVTPRKSLTVAVNYYNRSTVHEIIDYEIKVNELS